MKRAGRGDFNFGYYYYYLTNNLKYNKKIYEKRSEVTIYLGINNNNNKIIKMIIYSLYFLYTLHIHYYFYYMLC